MTLFEEKKKKDSLIQNKRGKNAVMKDKFINIFI